MKNIECKKYQSLSAAEMENIGGGRKTLLYTTCYYENEVLVETKRTYQHEFLGLRWKTEKSDAESDVCPVCVEC